MWAGLFLIGCLLASGSAFTREEVTFNLGSLGPVTGITHQTKEYNDAPYSGRTYYKFRAIPYTEEPMTGQNRFRQSRVRTSPFPTQPFDATRTGPLCQQGTFAGQEINDLMQQTLEELLLSALPNDIGGLVPEAVVAALLAVVEILIEVPVGTLDKDKLVVDILHDWLDIDFGVAEDCLHLAVSTPWHPDGTQNPNMPVMFYIHGGGFSSGFQIRMGADRLASYEDVVVVAINYRLGPLGFLCLDTDEAAGNMGMLDMIVALEWAQQYISYFGGDPSRITLFGESAGSASIGHLVLSDASNGLFAQAIGSSGSPLATWAFDYDNESEMHARAMAAKVNCDMPDLDQMVNCLRNVDAEALTSAYESYQAEQRLQGGLGFGGTNPCGQTRGARKFYNKGQDPVSIARSGSYQSVPIMFGANKNEGVYVYTVQYNEFLVPQGLHLDDEFLHYGFMPQIFDTMKVEQYFAMKQEMEFDYFDRSQIGNLTAMIPGFTDIFSVFFFKAPGYEMVEQNSAHSYSYWYAFDYVSLKSLFNLAYMNPADKAGVMHPGVSHGDETIYLFDVELPLVWCNLGEMANDALECLNGLDAINCLVFPNGEFRTKWHYCLTGELSPEETQVSSIVARAWSGFAANGNPGFGSQPWTNPSPMYLQITNQATVLEDFTREYHITQEESRNRQ